MIGKQPPNCFTHYGRVVGQQYCYRHTSASYDVSGVRPSTFYNSGSQTVKRSRRLVKSAGKRSGGGDPISINKSVRPQVHFDRIQNMLGVWDYFDLWSVSARKLRLV